MVIATLNSADTSDTIRGPVNGDATRKANATRKAHVGSNG